MPRPHHIWGTLYKFHLSWSFTFICLFTSPFCLKWDSISNCICLECRFTWMTNWFSKNKSETEHNTADNCRDIWKRILIHVTFWKTWFCFVEITKAHSGCIWVVLKFSLVKFIIIIVCNISATTLTRLICHFAFILFKNHRCREWFKGVPPGCSLLQCYANIHSCSTNFACVQGLNVL